MRIRMADGSLLNLSDSDNWAIQVLPTEEPPDEIMTDDADFEDWVASRSGDTALVLVQGDDTIPIFEGPYDVCMAASLQLLHEGWVDFGPEPAVGVESRDRPEPAPSPDSGGVQEGGGRRLRSHRERMYAGD